MSMISSVLMLSLAFGGSGRARGNEASPPEPPTGWSKTAYSVHFTAEDLHEYLNGGAAKYLAYGILALYVQEYERLSDGYLAVVELYILDSPKNAFGVYSCDSGGSHPPGLGEGASFEGGLLQFWSGRGYVRIYPREPSTGKADAILELGTAMSKAPAFETIEPTRRETGPQKPEGRDKKAEKAGSRLPKIVTSMPVEGMIEDSLCFFHKQVSLNSIYYLSERNILQLSEKTDAVSAEYESPSGEVARVIAVCYPEAAQAAKAYDEFCALYMGVEPRASAPDSGATSEPAWEGGASGDSSRPSSAYSSAVNESEAKGADHPDSVGDKDKRAASNGATERLARAAENEWLYAGLADRLLTLVLEAATKTDALEIGRTVSAAAGDCDEGDEAPAVPVD